MNKPKMYQNKVNKEFHNNMSVYTSYGNNNKVVNNIDSGDIRKKINNIINANNFIYSKMVYIVIIGSTIMRKIIGLYGDNLITIDNEYIPITNIEDIYIK